MHGGILAVGTPVFRERTKVFIKFFQSENPTDCCNSKHALSRFPNTELPEATPLPDQPGQYGAFSDTEDSFSGSNNQRTPSESVDRTTEADEQILPPAATPGAEPSAADTLSASPSTNLTHESYTIGWICSLDIELAAAMQMFDVAHPSLRPVPGDKNSYMLGSMCGHNVIVAVLPAGQMGIASATTVAENMMRTFPKIRVGLLVGIGGGIPSKKHDIRIGDIVVSQPSGTFGESHKLFLE